MEPIIVLLFFGSIGLIGCLLLFGLMWLFAKIGNGLERIYEKFTQPR